MRRTYDGEPESERMNIGIEIECLFNTDIQKELYEKYTNGTDNDQDADDEETNESQRVIDGWFMKGDGSLAQRGEKWNNYCIEIITDEPTKTFKQMWHNIEAFIRYFSKNGKYELKDVLSFNETCGCHIHFSVERHAFRKKWVFDNYKMARRIFFKRLKDSEVLSIEDKRRIKKHYFRRYAKMINKDKYSRERDRYLEWNPLSEKQGKGMEWRSFNLLGIDTWVKFKEMFKIAETTMRFIKSQTRNFEYRKVYNVSRYISRVANEKNKIKIMEEEICVG